MGFSATQFWEEFFNDEAEHGFNVFMDSIRNERDVKMNPWADVDSIEDGALLGLTAKKMRVMTMIVNVKGNPIVKDCPTTKTYYLLE